MANVSPRIVFGMLFLTLSGANVDFLDRELCWKTYTTKKALLTIWRVELIGKKKFAAASLNPEYETFVVYIVALNSVTSLSSFLLNVYLFCKFWIVGLIAKKVLKKVPNKYIKFADIFSLDLVSKLLKHIEINDHTIKLVNG